MTWNLRKYCFLIIITLCSLVVQGQPGKVNNDSANISNKATDTTLPVRLGGYSYIIGDFYIHGNRVTKRYIIERELPFKKGDTMFMPDLIRAFEAAREHLINTRLFNDVIVSLKEFRGFTVDIQIDVKERWYIFPLPYVRPVDRNFTAWAEKNYSLSRLDYGLRYSQYNFTGRNDYLRIWLITGYSNQVELAYDLPYVDKNLKHGFGFGFSYANVKELNVNTVNNQQEFINSDTIPYASKYLREQLSVSLRYYYRPALKTRHLFR